MMNCGHRYRRVIFSLFESGNIIKSVGCLLRHPFFDLLYFACACIPRALKSKGRAASVALTMPSSVFTVTSV